MKTEELKHQLWQANYTAKDEGASREVTNAILDVMVPLPADNKQPVYNGADGGILNRGARKSSSIWNVDYVDPLGFGVARRARLVVLADNDAVIKMVVRCLQ